MKGREVKMAVGQEGKTRNVLISPREHYKMGDFNSWRPLSGSFGVNPCLSVGVYREQTNSILNGICINVCPWCKQIIDG